MGNAQTERKKRQKARKRLRLTDSTASKTKDQLYKQYLFIESLHDYAEIECGLDYLSECGDK